MRDIIWVCFDCVEAVGGQYYEGHMCTAHEDVCDVCGEVKPVTEPRDFRVSRMSLMERQKELQGAKTG